MPDKVDRPGCLLSPAVAPPMIFRVDFNNTAAGDRLKASLRHASSSRIPAIGERVCLHDAEGNSCWARIDEVREPIVLLEPDWDSWSAALSR